MDAIKAFFADHGRVLMAFGIVFFLLSFFHLDYDSELAMIKHYGLLALGFIHITGGVLYSRLQLAEVVLKVEILKCTNENLRAKRLILEAFNDHLEKKERVTH
jgi:hypothetical protein